MQWNWWRLENELQSFHHPAEMSGILHLQSKKENAKENWEGCFKEKYCSELQPKKTKSMRTSISKRWDPFQKKQFLTKYASWNPVKLLRRITQMRCQILFSNLLLAQKKALYSSKFQPKVQNNPTRQQERHENHTDNCASQETSFNRITNYFQKEPRIEIVTSSA